MTATKLPMMTGCSGAGIRNDAIQPPSDPILSVMLQTQDGQTTNNVENFFGVFKKGMVGVYHFCGQQHLQRYLDEFSFRYCNRSGLGVHDNERAALTLKGIEGKRLTYRRPN